MQRVNLLWSLSCALFAFLTIHNPAHSQYQTTATTLSLSNVRIATRQVTQTQMEALQTRAAHLDRDNKQLQKEVAQSQQQVKLLRDQVTLLQKRLAETTKLLQDAQQAKQNSDQQLQALQVSTQHKGGATLTANNSQATSLKAIEIPGVDARLEGDVIRIRLPAEKLFQPGTAQISPAALPLIDQIASAITGKYPRQLIAIEGHTDNTVIPTNPPITSHQLASIQATAIFNVLARRNRLPAQQLFLVAHGANHPVASNATPAGKAANRRVELVVYPEQIGS